MYLFMYCGSDQWQNDYGKKFKYGLKSGDAITANAGKHNIIITEKRKDVRHNYISNYN